MTFKKVIILFVFMFAAIPAFAIEGVAGIEKYEVDRDHTNIVWYISHMGFSRNIGHFKKFEVRVD